MDTQFVSTDIKGIIDRVQSTSQGDASSTSLPYMLDLVRIAGQGAAAMGSMPMGTPYYRRSQAMVDETDKGWWNANGKVQLKRPQMGQTWRTTHGMPIFADLRCVAYCLQTIINTNHSL